MALPLLPGNSFNRNVSRQDARGPGQILGFRQDPGVFSSLDLMGELVSSLSSCALSTPKTKLRAPSSLPLKVHLNVFLR